jgi:hypothetical protein
MYSSHLTIAGVDFRIESDLAILDSFFPAAYSEFAGAEPREQDCEVPVRLKVGTRRGLEQLEKVFEAGDMWALFRDGARHCIAHMGNGVESPMWCAELGLEARSIEVHCAGPFLALSDAGEVSAVVNPLRYPLDQLMLAYVLGRIGGVLLHSSGVIYGDKMWLLAGVSGAGKSTSAGLLKGVAGVELVSDDRIVVRPAGQGSFMGYGTPWPGEARIAVNRHLPLGGILFLDKDPVNRIEKIECADALERLMAVASLPWYEPELLPGALDFCGSLVEDLPVYSLKFRPDAEAAEMVREFLAGSKGE